MSERFNQFSHLPLRLTNQGTATPSGGGGKPSAKTLANRGNAGGHGKKLNFSISSIISSWEAECEKRKEEGKPELPDAISFILQVDPNLFDADALKSFGIEVVADLEEGYIIGASADTGLSELRIKIQLFIESTRGGGKVPEIWEILEGTKRPEYILSPSLQSQWDQISDCQEYIVDVGISCINIQEQYSRCPKRERCNTDASFQKSINKWLDKHNLTPEEWDDLYSDREAKFLKFIQNPLYRGEILRSISGDEVGISRLPDSFSCRIRILGNGLKDLVLNFPYIFDVSEADEFIAPSVTPNSSESGQEQFELEAPEPNAPKVCIIDSGIQENHPKVRVAIDSTLSTSWVPGETNITADYCRGGGHGTRVAGAVLYPQGIPKTGRQQAVCWLQNARILNARNELPKLIFPPDVLEEIVTIYYHQTRTRIYNHSIAGISPCRTQSMTPWAAAIDKLSWENDVLFIVAAGNIEAVRSFVTRPSIAAHIQAGRNYPEYLLQPSARVANPAQSFQALTVGSIAHHTYTNPPLSSIAKQNYPSSFSCSGPGIWENIKPEVVEYGGDYVIDSLTSPSFTTPELVCPELIRSTRDGGKAFSADAVGTSFAAPKVTHIAAALEAAFPQESTLLYRALIVQSARLPRWTNNSNANLCHAIRTMGYGIPDINRALGNSLNRVTLTTRAIERIQARQAKVYQVKVPENFLPQGEGFDILIEITLSYVAEPRRTRRNRRKYLSTWLDWTCSKRGEDPDRFLDRVLKDYDAPEETEEDDGLFQWTLGKRQLAKGQTRPNGIDGIVKELSRSTGTVQKDWATIKSYELREGFCIAVVGHTGWNQDPNAEVPFALAVSFEAVNSDIDVYTSFVEAEAKVQPKARVQQEIQIQQSV
ncbi:MULTISPECIES: S8 family peptidase [Nostoc]|uniref:S8 family peptidase n=2 Tax=Nostoc TaxID=1177 RepID=A0ABR8IHE6_9NOSO|nr:MULTISPECIES: S8 family peptidase [Nostoc]MBD2565240.1 S8 family peptidase [Nostoc linckia FACHB-391]MBD2650903.1 S8 family peptidase [Nostoc foliaceum FACHB-393]